MTEPTLYIDPPEIRRCAICDEAAPEEPRLVLTKDASDEIAARMGQDACRRNVIAALRQALAEHPEGCLEARLWHGVEACGVARRVFNEAIAIMFDAGWSSRRHGRLFSGPAPMGEPRLLIPSDWVALSRRW